jgi:hypothetical protein
MKVFIIALMSLFSAASFGFEDETYRCKNSNPELPNNIYRISTAVVQGNSLPFLDISRFVKGKDGQAEEIRIRGLGSVVSKENSEILYVNQIGIEIIDGKMIGCKTEEN